MTITRATPNLYKWVAVSALIHLALVFVPMHIFEAVFPRSPAQSYGLPKDLTPDFAEIAIAVVQMPQVPAIEAVDGPVQEIDDILFPRVASPALPPSKGGGGGHPLATPQFFPARPRLIVPPHLDDLEITDLTISLRILVGSDGRPEEVILPDSLENQEIRRRLLESALKFRFEPAKRGDLPVASWIDLPLVLESSRRR